MVTLSDRLHPNNEDVGAQVIDGEAIIINLSNGMYYSLDNVGGKVWEMIEDGSSLAEMTEVITSLYKVPGEQVNADVERLVEELVKENLVTVSEEGPTRNEKPELEPQHIRPYDTPTLKIYRDMADLLALDPPTPGLQEIAWKEPESETSN